MKKQLLLGILGLGGLFLAPDLQAQCGCGDGSEGAFNATSNTTLAGGVHNFTTFTIAPGVVVRATGTAPLDIRVQGAVTIEGTLDVSGANGSDGITYSAGGTGGIGVAGGGNGGAGSFSVSGGPIDGGAASGDGVGAIGLGWSGGGGAGHSAAGQSSGGVGGAGGPAYGTPQLLPWTMGSGGGGGSGGYNCGAGGGGAGGGAIKLTSCVSVNVTASGLITAKGGNGGSDGTGSCGGGGAGSGGSIWVVAPTLVRDGSIIATGGTGGLSTLVGSPYFGLGGNGADGRTYFEINTATGQGTINPTPLATGPFSASVFNGSSSGTNLSCNGAGDGTAICGVTSTNGGETYVWSNGATSSTITGLPAGCFTVTVTDAGGCTTTDTVCITEPAAIMLIPTTADVTCNSACDGSVGIMALGGTGGYTYFWTPSNGNQPSLSNVCAGNYIVDVTDSTGCVETEVLVVSEPTALVATATGTPSSTMTSNDGSATANVVGGTPGYTYLWTPGGATTASITNLALGNYTVQVTDSNGCVDTGMVYIDVLVGVADQGLLGLQAIPNPTHGVLRVQLDLPAQADVRLELIDPLGRVVYSTLHQDVQALETRIETADLGAGVYQLRARTEAGMGVLRVVVQH